MSDIQDIINKREHIADMTNKEPNEYQRHIDNLRAMDVLADALERVATALEKLNGTRD